MASDIFRLNIVITAALTAKGRNGRNNPVLDHLEDQELSK